MATLQMYLVPKFSTSDFNFGEGSMYATGLILCEYFNKVCASVEGFSGSDYHWEGEPNIVRATDLVCYVVSNQGRSIVQHHTSEALGPAGSTIWSTKSSAMISEVYMTAVDGDPSRSRLLANLVFHEWMHNKLDTHPSLAVMNDVHSIVHGVLSHSPINSSMRPSDADNAKMQLGIPLAIPQYTGRF